MFYSEVIKFEQFAIEGESQIEEKLKCCRSTDFIHLTSQKGPVTYMSEMLQLPRASQDTPGERCRLPFWAQCTVHDQGAQGQVRLLPKKENLWKWHLDNRVKAGRDQEVFRKESDLLAHNYPCIKQEEVKKKKKEEKQISSKV